MLKPIDKRADCIARLQQFYRQHGRVPTAGECGVGGANRRQRNPDLPYYDVLYRAFGSLNKALIAAGLTPRQQGVRVDYDPATRHMIFANKSAVPTTRGQRTATTDRIECPRDRMHHPRMIHERRYGVTTGRMVAWCYECQAEVPPGIAEVAVTAAEKVGSKPFTFTVPKPTGDVRKRYAEIRLAWSRGSASMDRLAALYGLSPDRIEKIVQGRKRSA
jgi:hypothetical protein